MTATDEHHGQLYTGYPHSLQPELHKALVARGIDYWVMQGITFWNRDDGCECLAYGYKANGVPKLAIKVVGFTDPAQAIAATLGERKNAIPTNPHATCVVLEGENPPEEVLFHGPDKVTHYLPERTCHNVHEPPKDTAFWPAPHFKCSECGHKHVSMNYVYFCPNCGRKVVDE